MHSRTTTKKQRTLHIYTHIYIKLHILYTHTQTHTQTFVNCIQTHSVCLQQNTHIQYTCIHIHIYYTYIWTHTYRHTFTPIHTAHCIHPETACKETHTDCLIICSFMRNHREEFWCFSSWLLAALAEKQLRKRVQAINRWPGKTTLISRLENLLYSSSKIGILMIRRFIKRLMVFLWMLLFS